MSEMRVALKQMRDRLYTVPVLSASLSTACRKSASISNSIGLGSRDWS